MDSSGEDSVDPVDISCPGHYDPVHSSAAANSSLHIGDRSSHSRPALLPGEYGSPTTSTSRQIFTNGYGTRPNHDGQSTSSLLSRYQPPESITSSQRLGSRWTGRPQGATNHLSSPLQQGSSAADGANLLPGRPSSASILSLSSTNAPIRPTTGLDLGSHVAMPNSPWAQTETGTDESRSPVTLAFLPHHYRESPVPPHSAFDHWHPFLPLPSSPPRETLHSHSPPNTIPNNMHTNSTTSSRSTDTDSNPRNRHVSFPSSPSRSALRRDQRRQSLTRRVGSMSERRSLTHFREDSENENPRYPSWRVTYSQGTTHPPHPPDESSSEQSQLREAQLLRGAMRTKMVASKSLLHSLEVVKVEDLPEDEKVCVICYNDYGTPSPEGVSERPMRLPHCKHVFGDHCINKWLQDSDLCPYCRDKLPAEPKRSFSHPQGFINLFRMRIGSMSPAELSHHEALMLRMANEVGDGEEFLSHLTNHTSIRTVLDSSISRFSQNTDSGPGRLAGNGSPNAQRTAQTNNRRAPPDDAEDAADSGQTARRTRQRRSSSPFPPMDVSSTPRSSTTRADLRSPRHNRSPYYTRSQQVQSRSQGSGSDRANVLHELPSTANQQVIIGNSDRDEGNSQNAPTGTSREITASVPLMEFAGRNYGVADTEMTGSYGRSPSLILDSRWASPNMAPPQ